MNKQESIYFNALSQNRTAIADMLDMPAVRGVKDSIVEKYSDQAHFIYELLQNADDAHATRARFILEPTQLIFVHNGPRHFSVSDPTTEDTDAEAGTLGDINAITGIANSNKNEASIGKFGVGFKAVYQYTSTPHIYDENCCFKIVRFIVPVRLDDDHPVRRSGETLFVFPFDSPKRSSEEAYSEIKDKLSSLSYPLLFLTHLKDIEFEYENVIGLYGQEIKRKYTFGDIEAENICLTQNNENNLYDENLFLFSRCDEYKRKYSVGFFFDDDGHLRPKIETAFCFFPTKEHTGLNFIIHAPFLLTDSREGIRAGVPYNDKMIGHLADLAAESIVCLKDIGKLEDVRYIDDGILDIIPYDPNIFSDPSDKAKISFRPFYDAIKEVFSSEELLPSTDGFVSSNNAYWAAVPQLPQVFSNKQLSALCDNEAACWVFPSVGRDETNRTNKALFSYIEDLVRTNLNEDVIISGRQRSFYYSHGVQQPLEKIKGITADFIEAQSISWLHIFYKWLSETKHRKDRVLDKPFFLDQDGHAAAAYDEHEQPILFLPVDNMTGFKVVNPCLIENAETFDFIKEIGIKQPSLRDQIYNILLPQYEEDGEIDTDQHFLIFFEYYCNHCINGDDDEFIDLIKEHEFLTCVETGDEKLYRGAADSIYLPSPELESYFESKDGVRFLTYQDYVGLVGDKKEKQLISFLTELGIRKQIDISRVPIDFYRSKRTDLPKPYSTKNRTYEEGRIDGCKEIVDYISKNKDQDKSVLLWNCLLSIIETRCSYRTLGDLLRGTCKYFYRKNQCEYFPSSDEKLLKSSAWLFDRDGAFASAADLSKESLSEQYNPSSAGAQALMEFLGIQSVKGLEGDDANLTDSQREKIRLADTITAMGISEADLEELKRIKRQREIKERQSGHRSEGGPGAPDSGTVAVPDSEGTGGKEGNEPGREFPQIGDLNATTSKVVRDIVRKTHKEPTVSEPPEIEDADDVDQDEYIQPPVDYSRRIEQAKKKSAADIDRIAYFEDLQNRALSMPKYSFGWFKTLLELESLNSGETASGNREVSISFAKVEQEPGTMRTLVLQHPSRYIPQFMEDLADIPLVLHMGETKRTLAIEVANVKSYTLRVKLKKGIDIEGLDLSLVTAATIDAKSPAFLLEELRKEFMKLGYDDDYDMQKNLCSNIEFIFGPPGTGKTTHLANNVILPLMKNESCKVLVLTPTNKAADVLTRRIMDLSGGDRGFEDWLVRFGATGDEQIEADPIFRDKTFDIRAFDKSVTITTIARFPYDFFMPHGSRVYLNGINWDYIIVDEASMIPIANIVYPLYKKTPKKFMIAGDPFQIEPITSVGLWKNENIYTMVHLDSFVHPSTIPHRYKMTLLTTQYRSIPEIGDIFSKLSYGGILKHNRRSESKKTLAINDGITYKAINIIKFPVSKYESIYRSKRLQRRSSYQIYSAIFTYEFICYLAKQIGSTNPGSSFHIGVIAPYRAQAELIDKLLASEKLPDEVDVQVGTIHGFQGDECDIIFTVFNTPPVISSSKEMFLNKRNIINVSISRARDYLFVIMPDDNTENIENLQLVKKVEQLIKGGQAWTEYFTHDLEAVMFGQPDHIENSVFSTTHQSVNVYGLPEKSYEVRTEETAVDIQIHKPSNGMPFLHSFERKMSVDIATLNHVAETAQFDLVPKELRSDAIEVQVTGTQTGKYYLVPYSGRLKMYTKKKSEVFYIPQQRFDQERLIPVSVVEEDKIIYIQKEAFKAYKKELTDAEEIEIRKTCV